MGTPPYGCRQLDPGSLDGPAATGLTHRVTPEPPDTTTAALTAQVSRMLCDAWRLRVDGPWTTALPAEDESGAPARAEPCSSTDRRIHLSATPRSAATMLERVVPILATHGIVFTFAADVEAVRWLGSRCCDQDVAGKALTAFPGPEIDDAELARELHAATADLPGPRILSARPYRPRSLVHSGTAGGSTDLPVEPTMFGRSEATRSTTPALLAGRYLLGQTLRRTPSNSAYLAVDTRGPGSTFPADATPADSVPSLAHQRADTRVVIEHARRHADIDEFGEDARGRLLHQARILRRLHRTVPVPEPLRVFALDQDLFLVQRYLSGVSFTRWVSAHATETPGVPPTLALPMARQLLALVSGVHHTGLVIRNLSPSKVLVAPDGRPMLIDLDSACAAGETARRIDADSCRAPEQCAGSGPYEASTTEDLYGLGALLFLMAIGTDPTLPAHDDGHDREDRLTTWLRAAAVRGETARRLAPAALGLLADDPAHRCDLVTAAARLESRHQGSVGREVVRGPGPRRLLDDGLSHLADTMTPDGTRLWPDRTDRGDPTNVQDGAAGVLSAFLGDLATGNERHLNLVRVATGWLAENSWIDQADQTAAERSPGLHAGAAGVAWVLAEAGQLLAEPAFVERAGQVARELPTTWPASGVASGIAGALLTQLKLYLATDRDEFAELASACVRTLRQAAVPGHPGPTWRLPEEFDPRTSGTAHYGFAHGVAGIGYALLVAGHCLSDAPALALASDAGHLLCDMAVADQGARIRWPVGPDNPRRRTHWCTGTSGIGTFLLRLWASTREPRFERYARAAADAVAGAGPASSTSACHGLTGDGQFLLDAAELLPDPRYHTPAQDLVALLSARYGRRRGRAVVADDSGAAVSSGYGTGLAGVLAYLLRLQHAGPRPFMIDQPLTPAIPVPAGEQPIGRLDERRCR